MGIVLLNSVNKPAVQNGVEHGNDIRQNEKAINQNVAFAFISGISPSCGEQGNVWILLFWFQYKRDLLYVLYPLV